MANGPSPTVEEIQLRKRARRRLIGAITLVAVMVAVLPMILDDEPKPVGQDIAIDIPSQQGSDFPLAAAKPPAPQKTPAATPPVQPQSPSPVVQPSAEPVAAQESHDAAVPAPVPAQKKPEAKPEPVVVPKKKESPADKPEKPKHTADKPTEAKSAEAKHVDAKPAGKVTDAAHGGGYVVLLGSFLSESNAQQRQLKLKALGVKFYLEKIKSPAGLKTAVRAGPYATRQEADSALARMKSGGIADGLVTEKK